MLANELADPVVTDTARHYAQMDSADSLEEEMRRRVKELTCDVQGNNTVRSEESGIESAIDALVLAIVSQPVGIHVVSLCRTFRQEFFVAASKVAGRMLHDDIRHAQEDAAVEAFEQRQFERREP